VNETEAPRFEQVVLPHLDAAYNLARWLVRDPALAEDIVQDAVLRALQYFASFRGDGGGRAWLLQIVRNAAYAAVKSKRIGTEVPLDTDEAMELPDRGCGARDRR
jgi:RNA polymerase sigma factor (sigma-70 family)